MKVYLVGGAVRDELLDLSVSERDYLVVGATEQQMLDLGYRRLDLLFPVFLHPDTGDEYALARRERKTGPGYKGFAVDAGPDVTLEQDLARRDLTINALARDESGRITDLFNGLDDLEEGILRHITPAFTEDPVRLLRAARFSARLGRWGFRLARETHALLRQMAGRDELLTLVPERLREEMLKALCTEQPWRFFLTLQGCGALEHLLPPLAAVIGEGAHGQAQGADPVRVLKCAAFRSPDPVLRLVALLAAALPDAEAGAALCRRLRLDRSSEQWLQRIMEWPAARIEATAPAELLELLEQIKALHHPQRLGFLQTLWFCLDEQSSAGTRLQRALNAASAVVAKDLVKSGWQGPALGRELSRQRLNAVSEALHGD